MVVRGCGHLRRRGAPARDSVRERGVSERERDMSESEDAIRKDLDGGRVPDLGLSW